jgi:transcriptional regulator GlxA family with amidase domain
MKIAHVLFEDAEELDFVGPWEVFTMARELIEMQSLDLKAPEVFTVSETGGTVRARKGMRIVADHSFAECPPPDIIVVPGGQGTRREVNNPAMLDWIAKVAPGCAWVTSVCTGSMLLTAAGPAKGKTVTTHWGFVETLRKRGEAREVKADARWVRDGNLVTAAGVSAGIDMALWLTGQIWSPGFARNVQRAMEYDPAPPYQADV